MTWTWSIIPGDSTLVLRWRLKWSISIKGRRNRPMTVWAWTPGQAFSFLQEQLLLDSNPDGAILCVLAAHDWRKGDLRHWKFQGFGKRDYETEKQ